MSLHMSFLNAVIFPSIITKSSHCLNQISEFDDTALEPATQHVMSNTFLSSVFLMTVANIEETKRKIHKLPSNNLFLGGK